MLKYITSGIFLFNLMLVESSSLRFPRRADWKYEPIKNLATSGIYSQKDLDRWTAENAFNPHFRLPTIKIQPVIESIADGEETITTNPFGWQADGVNPPKSSGAVSGRTESPEPEDRTMYGNDDAVDTYKSYDPTWRYKPKHLANNGVYSEKYLDTWSRSRL